MSESQIFEIGSATPPESALRGPLVELNMEILESQIGTVAELQGEWQALSVAARLRLAGCPFLLVDAGFSQAGLWAKLANHGVHDPVPRHPAFASRSALPTPLLRHVLLLAWHMARADPNSARIALGMSRDCADVVARYGLGDLEALAEFRPAWIRPRWEQHAGVWRAWLIAAARHSPRRLEALQLWGLQTLAAEVRRGST